MSRRPSSRSQLIAVAGLLCATFAWGASFILVKMTIAEMNLYYYIFLRFCVATALMVALFPRRIFSADRATIKAAFVLALLLSTIFFTQTEGLRHTSAANSALITCLYMVFIPLFCLLFQKVAMEPYAVVGALLSFSGMYLLTSYSLTGINVGDFLTLLCAIACAWHMILTGRYAPAHGLVPLVTYQLFFTAVISGGVAMAQGAMTASIPAFGIVTILLTAVFATVMAFLVMTHAQRILSPTRTGVICSMEAVFGALIPWSLGFERPTAIAIAGAATMVVGMVLSELSSTLAPMRRKRMDASLAKLTP